VDHLNIPLLPTPQKHLIPEVEWSKLALQESLRKKEVVLSLMQIDIVILKYPVYKKEGR
jgi:hypothetical protein